VSFQERFQEQYAAEFLQQYVDFRRITFLMLIHKLNHDLYLGIYGEEPPG